MNKFDPKFPFYDDDSDYNTNANSYYKDLGRKTKLIKLLAKRIWEYDERLDERLEDLENVLQDYLSQWDERIENLDKEVSHIFVEWLNDGTLEQIINDDVLGNKADKSYVDELNEHVTEQFAQFARSVTEFGTVGDGITDDTNAIQLALDEAEILFFPTGTYYFDNVNLKKSDTTILFDKNVTLKSDDQGDNLDGGAFNVTGEVGETTSILEPIEIGGSSFEVEDLTPFKVGDLVRITQDRPETHERDYDIHKQMYSQSLVTIRAIDPINNIIGVNEPIEHRFFSSPKVTLIKPVENVKIIGQSTKFDKMGTTEYSNHFNIQYAKNFQIEGFETFNGGGKGVSINRSYRYTVKDMVHHSPTNVSAGHGYGMIARGSSYGLIDNHYTYNSRHAVDISTMSYQTIVRNSYAFNSQFGTHGTNSQSLTFDNCHTFGGGFSIGNYSFWSDNDVKIINCSANGADFGGVSIAAGSYNVTVNNLDVNNSVAGITILEEGDNVVISNVRISNVTFGIQARSKNINLTNIFIEQFTNQGIQLTHGTNNLVFNNIQLVSDNEGQAIRFTDCSNVAFNNLNIRGDYSRVLYFNENSSDIQISSSRIDTADGGRMIELVSNNGNIGLTINDSILDQASILVKEETGIEGLTFNNNKINGTMNIRGVDRVFFTNNEINDPIGLNTNASNMLVTGNFGGGRMEGVPENSENVLVDMNIL